MDATRTAARQQHRINTYRASCDSYSFFNLLTSDTLLDKLLNAAIGRVQGKGGDEQTLLRSIQDTFQAGDIVMGDAFFATCFFIAAMQARGVDILMEQNHFSGAVSNFFQKV